MIENPNGTVEAYALVGGKEVAPGEWNGIPSLEGLLKSGGLPGVEYCLVPAQLMGTMQRQGWSQVRDTQAITIHGPSASCDSVLLMGRGNPIQGAMAGNGRRVYHAREELLVDLGFLPPEIPQSAPVSEILQEEKIQVRNAAKAALARHNASAS